MHVKDSDHGFKKRVKAIKSIGHPEVTIGIHEAEGGATYENGASVLDVAIWNEFGTDRIPPRSFLRAWYDENRTEVLELWTALMREVAEGKTGREVAIDRFGLKCVGQIQQRIADGIPPPNADSTVKQKGSSKPLIRTGQLRSAITFKSEG